jgi:hypothetical protein
MKTVYKEVLIANGQRRSIMFPIQTDSELDDYILIYRPRRWITPRVGRILCFRDLSSAKMFAERNFFKGTYEIWEAKAKGVSRVSKVLDPWFWRHNPSAVEVFWSNFELHKYIKTLSHMRAPEGTVGVKAIKLEKKVA